MKKSENLKSIIIISLIVIFSLSTTYAFLNISSPTGNAEGQAGCFEVAYVKGADINSSLESSETNPQNTSTELKLSKSEECQIYTEADIYIHTNDTTTAPITSTQALKYKIEGTNLLKDGKTVNSLEGVINTLGDQKIATVKLTTTPTNYKIYIWVDSTISQGNYNDKTYSGYIYASSTQTSTVDQ